MRVSAKEQRGEDWLGRCVVVPQIMMNELEVPYQRAGLADSATREFAHLLSRLQSVIVRACAPRCNETSSRQASTEIIAQALPAPVGDIVSESGCQLQRRLPVLTSKAPTTPLGHSTRWLSATDDPIITKPSATAGGEG